MDTYKKKELIMHIYRTSSCIQKTIESQMDTLVTDSNFSKEFNKALFNLVEAAVKLLKEDTG